MREGEDLGGPPARDEPGHGGSRRRACTVRGEKPLVVCVAGNPNVGKSTLFTCLTGEEAEAANYPGITVDLNVARDEWQGRSVEVLDLPGTYSLGALAGDERLAWEVLLERRPDVVIAVVDATNLARNLYMVLQLLDLGFRVVVALNMSDEARKRKLHVDARRLSRELGVPVVDTVASTGEGVGDVKLSVGKLAAWSTDTARAPRRYSPDIEGRLAEIGATLTVGAEDACDLCGMTPRAAALAVVEGFGAVCQIGRLEELRRRRHVGRRHRGGRPDAAGRGDDGGRRRSRHHAVRSPDGGSSEAPRDDASAHETAPDDVLALQIAGERHAAAAAIADVCSQTGHRPTSEALWRLATRPATGVPIALVVLAGIFAALFVVGGWISEALTWAWEAAPAPLLERGVEALLGDGAVGDTILWAVNGGIFATLAVGIPYIGTFYLMIAVLEDSGYMNAVAYLSDRVMHRFGLHGRAVIPLLVAGGCRVPAIMGTRVLGTRRERIIAGVLITLVPCSASTAVIVGAVSLYAGWQWALFVYGVLFVITVAAGLVLNRLIPGEPGGLVMEMFPLRRPAFGLVLRKTWARLKDFIWIAAPVILLGSLVLGALYETGLVWRLTDPLAPVVEWWLGLPAVAGLTLLFGVLRKELALQLLVAFAVVEYGSGASQLTSFMTPDQIVVFALVNSLFLPCASTMTVLGREMGWRVLLGISAGTLAIALLVGGAVARLLALG